MVRRNRVRKQYYSTIFRYITTYWLFRTKCFNLVDFIYFLNYVIKFLQVFADFLKDFIDILTELIDLFEAFTDILVISYNTLMISASMSKELLADSKILSSAKLMVEIAITAKKIVNLLYFFIFSLLCYIYVTFIKLMLQMCDIYVN